MTVTELKKILEEIESKGNGEHVVMACDECGGTMELTEEYIWGDEKKGLLFLV